ncbi:MAG: hypothetical protein J7545_09315 [Roseofilum sp. SBFL]|nr:MULTISPECIES: hypothetical protein [unclassified Roseofilum]MBP0015499.1 hypothetical protein [Roseofilum sp. SID3]MBP0022706.1 hypothetical protein [Roseofilum sp. SID2]MBP0037146.1 hypothetical protein [Roseofilum sp. SID1]MBP0042158.1 hypothetical protein [Roseofilum sp. SBFL]
MLITSSFSNHSLNFSFSWNKRSTIAEIRPIALGVEQVQNVVGLSPRLR